MKKILFTLLLCSYMMSVCACMEQAGAAVGTAESAAPVLAVHSDEALSAGAAPLATPAPVYLGPQTTEFVEEPPETEAYVEPPAVAVEPALDSAVAIAYTLPQDQAPEDTDLEASAPVPEPLKSSVSWKPAPTAPQDDWPMFVPDTVPIVTVPTPPVTWHGSSAVPELPDAPGLPAPTQEPVVQPSSAPVIPETPAEPTPAPIQTPAPTPVPTPVPTPAATPAPSGGYAVCSCGATLQPDELVAHMKAHAMNGESHSYVAY